MADTKFVVLHDSVTKFPTREAALAYMTEIGIRPGDPFGAGYTLHEVLPPPMPREYLVQYRGNDAAPWRTLGTAPLSRTEAGAEAAAHTANYGSITRILKFEVID